MAQQLRHDLENTRTPNGLCPVSTNSAAACSHRPTRRLSKGEPTGCAHGSTRRQNSKDILSFFGGLSDV